MAHARLLVGNVAGCKWRVELAGWNALKAAVSTTHLFALVNPAEVNVAPFCGHKNTFTLDGMIKRVSIVDGPNSAGGLK